MGSTTCIHYLAISVGQEWGTAEFFSRAGRGGARRGGGSFTKLCWRSGLTRVLIWRLRVGGHSQAHSCGRIRIQFLWAVVLKPQVLAGCWPEATLRPSPRGPLQHGIFTKVYKPRRQEGESANKVEVTLFCNLVTEVTPLNAAILYLLEASYSRRVQS